MTVFYKKILQPWYSGLFEAVMFTVKEKNKRNEVEVQSLTLILSSHGEVNVKVVVVHIVVVAMLTSSQCSSCNAGHHLSLRLEHTARVCSALAPQNPVFLIN